jgi:hypothetical protein
MITRMRLGVLVIVVLSNWATAADTLSPPIILRAMGFKGGYYSQQNNIVGSNANPLTELSSTEPTSGGNGGNVEIFSGVVVNVGDGRDGDLNRSIELDPGEYFYGYIALTELPSKIGESKFLTITIRGHVIIHCQHIFQAIIRADYADRSEPPILEVYAGYPRAPERDFETSIGHEVCLDMSAPASEIPLDGGSFIFHTNAVGKVIAALQVDGGYGYNGGKGGNGGSIKLYANDGVIQAHGLSASGGGRRTCK